MTDPVKSDRPDVCFPPCRYESDPHKKQKVGLEKYLHIDISSDKSFAHNALQCLKAAWLGVSFLATVPMVLVRNHNRKKYHRQSQPPHVDEVEIGQDGSLTRSEKSALINTRLPVSNAPKRDITENDKQVGMFVVIETDSGKQQYAIIKSKNQSEWTFEVEYYGQSIFSPVITKTVHKGSVKCLSRRRRLK